MPAPEIEQNSQRISGIIQVMDIALRDADLRLQTVCSSHLVTLASGHIEICVRAVLGEYARLHSNGPIKKFTVKTLEWENSLNCEKINKILDRFDKSWKDKLDQKITFDESSAVDSLKTLRDDIAHGKHNGTGYITVKEYYSRSLKYISKLKDVIS